MIPGFLFFFPFCALCVLYTLATRSGARGDNRCSDDSSPTTQATHTGGCSINAQRRQHCSPTQQRQHCSHTHQRQLSSPTQLGDSTARRQHSSATAQLGDSTARRPHSTAAHRSDRFLTLFRRFLTLFTYVYLVIIHEQQQPPRAQATTSWSSTSTTTTCSTTRPPSTRPSTP